jgi:hypothetical protein
VGRLAHSRGWNQARGLPVWAVVGRRRARRTRRCVPGTRRTPADGEERSTSFAIPCSAGTDGGFPCSARTARTLPRAQLGSAHGQRTFGASSSCTPLHASRGCGTSGPIPAEPGVYAWYFRETPDPRINLADVHHADGLPLLYVGISPKQPPANGMPASRQSLRSRVLYHYRGNAAGSTLRLTLGCLLAPRLGTALRRVGSGSRLTFADGEAALSEWMAENALVTWLTTPAPWQTEAAVISRLDLPLNLDQNDRNGFHAALKQARRDARSVARSLPVISTR